MTTPRVSSAAAFRILTISPRLLVYVHMAQHCFSEMVLRLGLARSNTAEANPPGSCTVQGGIYLTIWTRAHTAVRSRHIISGFEWTGSGPR